MMVAGLLLLALLQGQAQPTPTDDRPPEKKKIDLDFSDQYKMLSDDLEKALRWKHLFRFVGIAEVHVYPARETGPYLGPPLHIWGNGFGTSMWRDPVTGWPLQ